MKNLWGCRFKKNVATYLATAKWEMNEMLLRSGKKCIMNGLHLSSQKTVVGSC